MIRSLKTGSAWWIKLGAKVVLSRLPIGYRFWQGIGLFRHGKMDSWHYAAGVLDKHVAKAGLRGALVGKSVVEIGPGDSVATAVLARAHGARAILVDAGRFAKEDVDGYRRLCAFLLEKGLAPPDLGLAVDLEGILQACGARYLTNGLESLKSIDTASVDLIFSQAVLEHVRRHQFLDTLKECRRILKPDGVCSHRVDLKDHLGGGLNNLRFSDRVWESDFLSSSGFYTNRIQYTRMLEMFREGGFEIAMAQPNRWDTLPIDRRKLAAQFRSIPDDELCVSGFDVILRPA